MATVNMGPLPPATLVLAIAAFDVETVKTRV
jgi:hypothetical protein